MLGIFSLMMNANAQVQRVIIQASGLTCSMCSNAINKSLRSLDIVEEVQANIQESKFEIRFKPNAVVHFDDLKNKVENAGFFVANMWIEMLVQHQTVKNDYHVAFNGNMFHFVHVSEQDLQGTVKLRLLDKGFVSAKEYKRNAKYTQMECYKTGVMGACCKEHASGAGTRIYHVTI